MTSEQPQASQAQISRGARASERDGAAPRIDVKSEVARVLIDAMEKGETPWQKPWAAQSLRPVNAATGNGYRGVNRLLLALSARCDAEGRADPRWATYQQAQINGWQVRRGEKGTPIVKVVEVARAAGDGGLGGAGTGPGAQGAGNGMVNGGDGGGGGSGSAGSTEREQGRKAFALRRYVVFNARQMDGVPELEAPTEKPFDPVERAEAVIQALKAKTGLLVVHGGDQACYVPALDEVRLPSKKFFTSVYDYYATAMHEGAHSTLHKKRMDRQEAIAKRWGDEAYAVEELRAEICSAILAAETGVPMGQAHIDNHAAYLQHWIKVVAADPMAIFSAAKDAELMAEYMLGLERQMTAMDAHQEWLQDYDRSLEMER